MANATGQQAVGAVESETSIIRRHDKLIRFIALPFAGRGVELDDLIQEARIALLDAAKRFDPSFGVTLFAYARKSVIGALIKYRTQEGEEPGRPGIDVPDAFDPDAVTADDALETAECAAILARDFSLLSEQERKVLRAYLIDDMDLREISRSLGHDDHKPVQRIYHGAVAKLRERMQAQL